MEFHTLDGFRIGLHFYLQRKKHYALNLPHPSIPRPPYCIASFPGSHAPEREHNEVVQAIDIRVPGEPGNEATYCILQVIKNWSQERPGNEASGMPVH